MPRQRITSISQSRGGHFMVWCDPSWKSGLESTETFGEQLMNPCHCCIDLTSHLRTHLFEASWYYEIFSNFTRSRKYSYSAACLRPFAFEPLWFAFLIYKSYKVGVTFIYNITNVIGLRKLANGLALTRGQRPLSRTVLIMLLLADRICAPILNVGTACGWN